MSLFALMIFFSFPFGLTAAWPGKGRANATQLDRWRRGPPAARARAAPNKVRPGAHAGGEAQRRCVKRREAHVDRASRECRGGPAAAAETAPTFFGLDRRAMARGAPTVPSAAAPRRESPAEVATLRQPPLPRRSLAALAVLSQLAAASAQAPVHCIAPEALWQVELLDTGGDGWEGAALAFRLRGATGQLGQPALVDGADASGRVSLSVDDGSSAFHGICIDPQLCYVVEASPGRDRDESTWVLRDGSVGTSQIILSGDTRSSGLLVGNCPCLPNQFAVRVIMTDSFGDGWGGIRMILSSDTFEYPLTIPTATPGSAEGSNKVQDLCLPAADACYVVDVPDGMHGDEISWSMVDPNNAQVSIYAQGGAPHHGAFQGRGTCRTGCTDSIATNYDSAAQSYNGNCQYNSGCMDSMAQNYATLATQDNGECEYDCTAMVNRPDLNLQGKTIQGCLDSWSDGEQADVTVSAGDVRVVYGKQNTASPVATCSLQRAPCYAGKFYVETAGALLVRWLTFMDRTEGALVAEVGADLSVHYCRFVNGQSDRTDPLAGWSAGGAIHTQGGSLQVKSSEFMSNSASGSNALTYGGAIFGNNGPAVEIVDSIFGGNLASRGGAIYISGGGSLLITGSYFDNHEATAGGCIETNRTVVTIGDTMMERSSASVCPFLMNSQFAECAQSGLGGSIFVRGGELRISGSTFAENTADTQGGAVMCDNVDRVVVQTTSFNRNGHGTTATNMNGGAIYVTGGEFEVYGCFFDDNAARGEGDSVYVDSVSDWAIKNTSFFPVDPYYTVYTTASPVAGCYEHPCDPGFECHYSDLSINCLPCPSTNFTATLAVSMVSQDGISCRPCPAGLTSNPAQTGCQLCPSDMYSTGGVCLFCDLGFTPSLDQTSCTPCGEGYYSGVNADTGSASFGERLTSCVRCRRGSQPNLPSAATGCVECTAGLVSTNGAACTPCPMGKGPDAVDGIAATRCIDCVGGTYSVVDPVVGNVCAACPAGQMAGVAQGGQTVICVNCDRGLYSDLVSNGCDSCEPGKQASADQTQCVPCFDVTPDDVVLAVSPVAQSAGLFSEHGHTCVACPAGTQPNGLASTCDNCTAGSASYSGGVCTPCGGNDVSNKATDDGTVGGIRCDACGGGSFSNTNHTECSCKAGEYDMSLGWFVCFGAHWDENIYKQAEDQLRGDMQAGRTCTTCPWCMDCTDPADPMTKPGYEFVHTGVGSEFFRLNIEARRKTTERGILRCPLDGSCLGTAVANKVASETCKEGHGGALCSSCTSAEVTNDDKSVEAVSFFKEGNAGSCVRCPTFTNINIPLSLMFFVLGMIFFWSYKFALPKTKWLNVVHTRYPRELGLQADLKTVIGTSQMLCLTPTLLRLDFPSAFAGTLEYVGLVCLDLRRTVHWDCFAILKEMSQGSTYFSDYWYYVVYLPVALAATIVMSYMLAKKKVMGISNMRQHMEASNELRAATVSRIAFAIFLVYPYITAVAVGANNCVELSESYAVLASDYAVRCDSAWLARESACTGTSTNGGDCSLVGDDAVPTSQRTWCGSDGAGNPLPNPETGQPGLGEGVCGLFGECGTDSYCVIEALTSIEGCPDGCLFAGSSDLNWIRATTPILIGAISIGFPCFIFVIIFVSKNKGPEELDPDGDLSESLSGEDGPAKPAQPMFGCFGSDFKPEYRMFEVVEYARKFVFAGLVGLLSPGSVEQIYFATAISMVCLVLYAGLQPYALAKCNLVKTAAELQLLLALVTALVLRFDSAVQGDELEDMQQYDDSYSWFLTFTTLTLTPVPLIWLNWRHAGKIFAEGEAGSLEPRLQYLIANGGRSDTGAMKDDIIKAHRAEIEKLRSAVMEFSGGSMGGLESNPMAMPGGMSEFEQEFNALQYSGNNSQADSFSSDPYQSIDLPSAGKAESGRALGIRDQGGPTGDSESSEEESSESSDSDSDGEAKPKGKKGLQGLKKANANNE